MATAQLATVLHSIPSQSVAPAPQTRSKQYLALNKRHRLFVDRILQLDSQKDAAIAIGCTEKSAATYAARLIRKVHVKAAIEAEMAIRAEANGLTSTFVLNSIRAIAEAEKTRNADKLTALTLLGKHLRLFAEQMDVNITHDLADRVAQARARVTSGKTVVPELLPNNTDQ